MMKPDCPREDAKGPLEPWMCGARKKGGSGLLCRAAAMANGRSRIHGGASLKGVASASYKHGKHMKTSFLGTDLPTGLRERYEKAIADPHLLSIRRYVALFEARIGQAIERYSQLDPGTYRTTLVEKWATFEAANARKAETDEERQAKATAVGNALVDIKQAIERGGDEAAAWEDVVVAVNNRIAATNSENRRMIAMQQMLSVEQAMELLFALNGILATRIQDKTLLSLIGSDIERRMGLTVVNATAVGDGDEDGDTAGGDSVDDL